MGYNSQPELVGEGLFFTEFTQRPLPASAFAQAVSHLKWSSLPGKFFPSLTMPLQFPAPGQVLGHVRPVQTWQITILLSSTTFHEVYLVSLFFFFLKFVQHVGY